MGLKLKLNGQNRLDCRQQLTTVAATDRPVAIDGPAGHIPLMRSARREWRLYLLAPAHSGQEGRLFSRASVSGDSAARAGSLLVETGA